MISNEFYGKPLVAIKRELVQKPTYCHEWIEEAAKFLSSVKIIATDDQMTLEEHLARLDPNQVALLNEVKAYFDKELENNPQYEELSNIQHRVYIMLMDHCLNFTQMKILYQSYIGKMPLEVLDIIADPGIPFTITNYMCQVYIEKHINLFEEIDWRSYNADQIREICSAALDDADYKTLAYSNLPASMMSVIRFAMNQNMDISIDPDTKSITIQEKKEKK